MHIKLREIPETGSIKGIEKSGTSFIISKYKVTEDTSIFIVVKNGCTVMHLDSPDKRWYLLADKYEHHPNIRLVLSASEVLLEPGAECPTFKVRD